MSLSSQMCLEDMGTLLMGSSTLMADPFGPLLDDDEESSVSEGPSSPLSFSSYSDSFTSSPFSPSTPSPVGCKDGCDASLPWLSADEQVDAHMGADLKEGDAFSGMDWMTEKIDISDFDLDSFIGSCDLDESPSSPEELLASLESQMELGLAPLQFSQSSPVSEEHDLPPLHLDLPLSEPEVNSEADSMEIKSEPVSPAPAPPSPTFTLELGSEVDISISDPSKSNNGDQQTPSLVFSLPPTHIVVVLATKEEPSVPSSFCSDQSDSGIESMSGSPPHVHSSFSSPKSASVSRAKPYSKPDPDADVVIGSKVKSVSGTSKTVDKKLKKMEQNKTAATRYRQKKREEQEVLNIECSELEKKNRELAEKADSISREIQYLKDLIEEVRSAKNRKNKVKADAP